MTSPPEPQTDDPRRRWPRRALLIALVLVNALALFIFLQVRSVESGFDDNVAIDPAVAEQLDPTIPDSEQPVTFLVIGSDSRDGLESLENFGEAAGERADVIILIKIYPEAGTAQMLSLPRDLYVDIPGHDRNRVNAAFAFGGAPLMVQTVRDYTGVPINHYVEVDFVGFQAIVDEMGGVEMDFPYPARDQKSGLDVDAGTQTLTGAEALAFARSRTYQELQGGSWVSVDADDFGRTGRQQQLIFSILRGLVVPSSILDMGELVSSFAQYLTVDARLAEESLVQLALRMRSVRPGQIEAATLPGEVATVGGASVVVPTEPDAEQLLAKLRAGEPMVAFVQSNLGIRVLNGNGVSGSAGEMADLLAAEGFTVSGVGDADRKDFSETTVLVRPDTIAFGELIIGELGFGIVEVGPVDSSFGALVIVGQDDT